MDPQRTAFIFPGQGSQRPGMGRELAEARPEAREIFDRADEILGWPVSRLCFEGTEDELKRTSNTQPALFVTSAAALAVLRAEGVEASFAAGHSLGEYTALYAAGALDFEAALRLVRLRGEAMEEAGRARPGAMAAVMGLPSDQIEKVCQVASRDGLVVAANWNSPRQVVLSGEVAGIEQACKLAKAAGARRVIRLAVGEGFHSPLMESAAAQMRPAIEVAPIVRPAMTFVANVSGAALEEPREIRESLILQITSCVRWVDCVTTMASAGAQEFIEVGPGKVLTGLIKRIDPSLGRSNFQKISDLTSAVSPSR